MERTLLPGTDLEVSRLCFGCWGLIEDQHWGRRNDTDCRAAVVSAVDQGVNFFDTATVYGDGASERLLGELLMKHGLRDRVVLASKVPPNRMRPDQIVKECEASLQRLQTDVLDLYQTHWTSREVPLDDIWETFIRLQQQGKVRHIGVCNMGPQDLAAVLDSGRPPATNQLPYNLLWRAIETAILPLCGEREIGVLAYSPLQHGILADKFRTAADVPDGRARSRHFGSARPLTRHGEPGCEDLTFETLAEIRRICREVQRPMSEVALMWLLQQPAVSCVIAGASSPDQLRQNVAAMNTPLEPEVVDKLGVATQSLKKTLGSDPDMWDGGDQARYR